MSATATPPPYPEKECVGTVTAASPLPHFWARLRCTQPCSVNPMHCLEESEVQRVAQWVDPHLQPSGLVDWKGDGLWRERDQLKSPFHFFLAM